MSTDYTYEIIKVDLNQGTMLVEYTPTDETVTRRILKLVIPLLEDGSLDEGQFARSIAGSAPIHEWERERLAKTNADQLANLVGLGGSGVAEAPAPVQDEPQSAFDEETRSQAHARALVRTI